MPRTTTRTEECENCGIEFEVPQDPKEQNKRHGHWFCGPECQDEWVEDNE